MFNSVCLCLTFKCNLMYRHCFVSAGPNRTEEMTYKQIALAIDNSYKNVDRIWFSGGEPTIVLCFGKAVIWTSICKREETKIWIST